MLLLSVRWEGERLAESIRAWLAVLDCLDSGRISGSVPHDSLRPDGPLSGHESSCYVPRLPFPHRSVGRFLRSWGRSSVDVLRHGDHGVDAR